jgi:hypothetical protein
MWQRIFFKIILHGKFISATMSKETNDNFPAASPASHS